MENKRGRGRPRVAEYLVGDNATHYEKVMTSGKRYRSRRSISDTIYTFTAAGILRDAASKIENLELLVDFQKEYMCRSILNQLGRMSLTEGYKRKRHICCESRHTGHENWRQCKRNRAIYPT
jgi:hypothetical protein